MGFSLGTTVVLIAGDVYKVALPLFFGTSLFALDIGPTPRMTRISGREVNLINIAQSIEGLTPARLVTINEDERNGIVDLFASAIVSSSNFCSVTYPNFIPEARADLTTSVDHLLMRPAQLGLSRWASLQAVEKVLKAYISEQGEKIKQIHVLDKLANSAEQFGLDPIDRTKLIAVQCSAGVRYGEESSTLLQAYEAHRAAIDITGVIAPQFKAKNDWKISRHDSASSDGRKKVVLLMRGTTADFARAAQSTT
jgi:hypothetical protein